MPLMTLSPSRDTPLEHLAGSVERVTFHSEETGFCVLRVKVRGYRDLVTVVGTAPTITPGEYIEAAGLVGHRPHPWPPVQDDTAPRRAPHHSGGHRTVSRLGHGQRHRSRTSPGSWCRPSAPRSSTSLRRRPQRLQELDGIGPKRTARVVAAWAEQQAIREIMVFLHSHGVGTARAVRIYKTYGTEAIARVQENPYRLALDIHGIGFKTADTLAQRLGIPRDAVIRAQAGVRHVLQTFADEGHCAVVQAELIEAATTLLEIPETIIVQAITLEVQEERLIAEAIDGQPCLLLAPLSRAEVGVATQLLHLLEGAPPWGAIDPRKPSPGWSSRQAARLAASQRAAVAQVLTGKVTVITGGPGVGKTTIVTSILQALRAKRMRVLLCAPPAAPPNASARPPAWRRRRFIACWSSIRRGRAFCTTPPIPWRPTWW